MSETNQGRTRLPFSMVPEWVIYAEISHGALRLYAVMARYANNDNYTAWPSRKELAEKMRVSRDTIDRYVKELEGIDAISVERRKVTTEEGKLRNQSNMYTLEVAAPLRPANSQGSRTDAANPDRIDTARGSRTDAARNYTHLELEPIELENTCSNEFFPAEIVSKEIAIIDNDKETVASMFEEFWDAYGRKEARKPAVKAWNKVIKDAAMASMVIAKARENCAGKSEKRFIKLAGGWLLDERWNDEIVETRKLTNSEEIMINIQKVAEEQGLI